MKTYSIGRDVHCDIVINDNTDIISRRHALLNVSSSGKMTIIDQSSNGTYVNGIRITPNVQVPVSRKDTISLAHVAKLDWNRVPRAIPALWYGIAAAGVVVVVAAVVLGLRMGADRPGFGGTKQPQVSVADSLERQRIERVRKDSVDRAERLRKDSLRRDSIRRVEAERAAVKRAAAARKVEAAEPVKRDTTSEERRRSKQDIG